MNLKVAYVARQNLDLRYSEVRRTQTAAACLIGLRIRTFDGLWILAWADLNPKMPIVTNATKERCHRMGKRFWCGATDECATALSIREGSHHQPSRVREDVTLVQDDANALNELTLVLLVERGFGGLLGRARAGEGQQGCRQEVDQGVRLVKARRKHWRDLRVRVHVTLSSGSSRAS